MARMHVSRCNSIIHSLSKKYIANVANAHMEYSYRVNLLVFQSVGMHFTQPNSALLAIMFAANAVDVCGCVVVVFVDVIVGFYLHLFVVVVVFAILW